MTLRIAPFFLCVFLLTRGVHGQVTVCDLFKDLKAQDGRQLTVSGDLLISKDITVLGAADCDNRYQTTIPSRFKITQIWPTALNVMPSPRIAGRGLHSLEDARTEAERLRRRGRRVIAFATFSGRLRVDEASDLPATLTLERIDSVKVEALPDPASLPVIPICELFQNLTVYRGQRIAVRAEGAGTFEGYWMSGSCDGGFVTNGYRWPVSLSYGTPAYYSTTTADLTKSPEVPDERVTAIFVGRLRMHDQYRGGSDGFGHMGSVAAELVLDAILDSMPIPTQIK